MAGHLVGHKACSRSQATPTNRIRSNQNKKRKKNGKENPHLIFGYHRPQSRERSPRAVSWSSRPFFYPLASLFFFSAQSMMKKKVAVAVCVCVVDPPPASTAPVGGTRGLLVPIDGGETAGARRPGSETAAAKKPTRSRWGWPRPHRTMAPRASPRPSLPCRALVRGRTTYPDETHTSRSRFDHTLPSSSLPALQSCR